MTGRRYFVHGVELVNCGGDLCSACERPAVGYLNAHPICATHAGWAAELADEYALEVEASAIRRAQQAEDDRRRVEEVTARLNDLPERERMRRAAVSRAAKVSNVARTASKFACGDPRSRENTYTDPKGKQHCRKCRRAHNAKSKSSRPSRALPLEQRKRRAS